MSAEDDIDDLPLEYLDLSTLEDGLGTNGESETYLYNDDVAEEEEGPELYSFEDYEPGPLELENNMCYTGLCKDIDYIYTIPYNSGQGGPNGKQFVRSRTLPTIPVYRKVSDRVPAKSPSQDRHLTPSCSASRIQTESPRLRSSKTDPLALERCPATSGHRATIPLGSPANHKWLRTNSMDRRRRVLPRAPTVEYPHSPGSAWKFEADDEDDSSDSMATSVEDKHPYCNASSQLYYTTPPKMQMAATFAEEKGGDKPSGLSKLTRRLSEKDRKRRDGADRKSRQRSQSVDFTDGKVMNGYERGLIHVQTTPGKLNKLSNGSSGASSPGANKLVRSFSGSKRKGSSTDSIGEPSKNDKKKVEKKLTGIQALFEAVEHQDMDLAKVILDTEELDLNSVNEEDLTPLDVAVMTNHVPMAKMLLARGAKENPRFLKNRTTQLNLLVSDAYKKVTDLTGALTSGVVGNGTTNGKENEQALNHWEFRHRLLKRMKAGYEHARLPDSPTNARLAVSSDSSLLVRFDEPHHHNGAVVTRYKVEWSCFETFSPLAGETIIEDLRHLEYEIPGLIQGNIYYVRVTAWNIKGWGPDTPTNPPYAVPSSWREVSGIKPRCEGKQRLLDDLFAQIKVARPADASEIKDTTPSGSPSHQRKNTVKKSIKNLFTSAPKFQKNLKRGVYLSCLLYHEDRVLVTNEDNLPILEVDENFSSTNLHSDFHWMMKIACTWEDVKSLRQDMEKISSSSAVHFRSKLLQAASQLQSALGIQDLGQFYFRPIKDANGSIILTTINYIKDPKLVNTTSAKWAQLSKINKKLNSTERLVAPDLLMSMVNEMIVYHQVSTISLPRGLYLGYLKLKSTVDLIRVLVPEKAPNVLPYTKIRDCPNVSKEEWEYLQSLGANEFKANTTTAQTEFRQSLVTATQRLLEMLGVSDDEAVTHRLYEVEVIELSPDVSFIVLLPPVESVCSVPGHSDEMAEKQDFLALPVQVFEMVHMCMFQYDFISRYSRLSSILEIDSCLALQTQREAFSSEELSIAKDRVEQLTGFQQTLDEAWKAMRWTMEIITYARDRNNRGGVPLSVLYAPPPSPTDSPLPGRKEVDSTSSDPGYHSDRGSNTDLHSNFNGTNTDTQDSDDFLIPVQNNNPGILRVYAAYDTGLAKGTSVKLHVTPRTTSREVIDLVVQQLNKAVRMKGLSGPVYIEDQLEDFCLVAVIGARERVLRDDYQPLQLQNPWTKGRLFVRLKSNLLAALEQGQSTAV